MWFRLRIRFTEVIVTGDSRYRRLCQAVRQISLQKHLFSRPLIGAPHSLQNLSIDGSFTTNITPQKPYMVLMSEYFTSCL